MGSGLRTAPGGWRGNNPFLIFGKRLQGKEGKVRLSWRHPAPFLCWNLEEMARHKVSTHTVDVWEQGVVKDTYNTLTETSLPWAPKDPFLNQDCSVFSIFVFTFTAPNGLWSHGVMWLWGTCPLSHSSMCSSMCSFIHSFIQGISSDSRNRKALLMQSLANRWCSINISRINEWMEGEAIKKTTFNYGTPLTWHQYSVCYV